jgi:CheY-like chemotaxis protein
VAIILIVDDEEPVRDFLAQVFSDAGHRSLQAIHGAQALEIVKQQRPDLVLSDVMMPVLNGAELCRRMKSSADTRSIPMILMSAAGWRAAGETGADAFIAKPFDLDEIEALVGQWLQDVHSRRI